MGSTSAPFNLTAEVQAFIRSLIQELPQPRLDVEPRPKFKDPQTFDGTKSRYEYWKHTLQQYVAGMEKDRAISLILSYVQGPNVEAWKDALYVDKHRDNAWTFATVGEFWARMDSIFIDPNLSRTAQAKLERLRMKGQEAQEFFTEFEQLCTQAGYEIDAPMVLNILQRGIRPDIVDRLYWASNAPGINGIQNTYENWKSRVLAIVQNESIHKAVMSNRSFPSQSTHTQAPQPSRQPAQSHAPIPTRRDGTGITFGGRGQPMDLDRLCLKCKMKKRDPGTCGDAWHVPNRKTPTTQYRRRWEEEEAQQEFFDEVRNFVVEDPDLFLSLVKNPDSTPEELSSFPEDSA